MITRKSLVTVVSHGLCVFFFFKQKTAYEMRISDWSSDVCSSDLLLLLGDLARLDGEREAALLLVDVGDLRVHLVAHREALGALLAAVAREVDRKSVV